MEVTGVRFETEGLGAALAGIGKWNAGVDSIGAGTAKAAQSVAALGDKIASTASKISLQERSLSVLGQELDALKQKEGASALAIEKKQLAYDRAAASIEDNKRRLQQLQAVQEQEAANANKAEVGTEKLGQALEKASPHATALASSISQASASASAALPSFSALDQVVIGGLRRIGEIAVNGIGLLASKIGEGVQAGFSFNNSMEQVTAQLNAFTKDGAVSADILEMIRERAAQTPFAFDEMARATAGLIPSANQAGVGLESLVEKAEILAASNPAEGLEGAAFALREAVSGDFTSIIERFNLPRQYINQLKDEGVPALEIVSRAMQQMGYDTDLVSNLAQTAQGRWSTLVDTFTTVASTVTQPVFDIFSESLGKLQAKLDENMPRILDIAAAIGNTLGNAVLWIADTAIPAMIDAWNTFGPAVMDGLSVLADFAGDAYNYGVGLTAAFADGIASAVSFVADALGAIGDTVAYWLQPNSPPKIVPDLDRWGADAINVYLDGWTQGNFAIFEEIGGLISSQLRSIAEQAGSAIPKDGLIPMILGTRSAVAEALEQLQETGEIGADAYQKIRDAAGPAGETIAGMLELLVEQAEATATVDAAQEAYNATVEEFTARLDELKAQRDAINESYENTPIDQAIAANEEQQRAIRDAEKAAKLQETINDTSRSESERKKAQLELERLQLEQQRRAEEKAREDALAGVDAQIAATEQEKTAAVDAAQTKLDEAKAAKDAIDAEVSARQSVIDIQQEQNDLVREQIQLLEQLAKEAERAAKAEQKKGGAGGGAKKPTVPTPARPQAPQRTPSAPVADTRNRRMEELNNLQEPQVDWLARLETLSLSARAALAGVATVIGAAVIPAIVAAAGSFAVAAAPLIALGAAGALLYTAWDQNFLGLQDVTSTVFGGIGETLGSAGAAFTKTREEGGTFWESLSAGAQAGFTTFQEKLPGMIEAVGGFFGRLIDYAFENVPQWSAALYEYGTLAVSWIAERLPIVAETVYSYANTIINTVLDRLPEWGATLANFGAKAWGWVLEALPGLGTSLGQFAGVIFGWIATTTADVVPKLLVLGGKFIWWLASDVIPQIPGVLLTFGEAILNFLTGFVTTVAPYLSKIGERFTAWVTEDALPFIGEKLEAFGQAIFDWVRDYIGRAKSVWASVGTAIVDGIKSGIANAWGAFLSWVDAQIAKLPQAVRDALGIHSPAATIVPSGEAIPDSLKYGMQQTMPGLLDAVGTAMERLAASIADYGPLISQSVQNLFDIGSGLGSFASKIVDRFKREFIDPLQNLIEQAEKDSQNIGDDLNTIDTERADLLKLIASATTDDERKRGQQRLAELEQRRTALAQKQLEAQKRQSILQQQANQQQKQLYALEKQRQQFEMFKAQQDLLDNLKKYGLDPKQILGGIDLGGDPSQLLEALQRAQAAILAKLGLNFGGGDIGTFGTTGSMAALTNPPGAHGSVVTNNGNTTIYNIDARGSNWTEAQFKRVIESTINTSVQGARTLRVMNA